MLSISPHAHEAHITVTHGLGTRNDIVTQLPATKDILTVYVAVLIVSENGVILTIGAVNSVGLPLNIFIVVYGQSQGDQFASFVIYLSAGFWRVCPTIGYCVLSCFSIYLRNIEVERLVFRTYLVIEGSSSIRRKETVFSKIVCVNRDRIGDSIRRRTVRALRTLRRIGGPGQARFRLSYTRQVAYVTQNDILTHGVGDSSGERGSDTACNPLKKSAQVRILGIKTMAGIGSYALHGGFGNAGQGA